MFQPPDYDLSVFRLDGKQMLRHILHCGTFMEFFNAESMLTCDVQRAGEDGTVGNFREHIAEHIRMRHGNLSLLQNDACAVIHAPFSGIEINTGGTVLAQNADDRIVSFI